MIIIVQRITDLNQVKSRSVYVDPRTHFLGEGASIANDKLTITPFLKT